MTSLTVANALIELFVPIGVAGAVIAVACALVAATALARGWAGLCGGAVGVWIVAAMLSVAATFASLWTPVLVSLAALAAALVLGAVARGLSVRRSAAA
ncbi:MULTISPECIES: hypothetical protein [Microbacterium]|uniref:hypothetical protein n=1 Tax=Microbacterium TaxID=33882 RepID=UPI00217D6A0D|nr:MULTISPECIES: hypothetical protein [Microbacterium]UWF77489.1 hypothetical protein JSY13_12205 [Microbacterium neungamense]WCM55652.1 hypothetical protein JRG78_12215 [Microbacterium sp. EF45047]